MLDCFIVVLLLERKKMIKIDLTATTPELGEGFPWAFDTHLPAQGIQKKLLC